MKTVLSILVEGVEPEPRPDWVQSKAHPAMRSIKTPLIQPKKHVAPWPGNPLLSWPRKTESQPLYSLHRDIGVDTPEEGRFSNVQVEPTDMLHCCSCVSGL